MDKLIKKKLKLLILIKEILKKKKNLNKQDNLVP